MDVILINQTTGVVDNVICADSVARAQQFYPDHLCVERQPGEPVGPGYVTRDGGQTFEAQS